MKKKKNSKTQWNYIYTHKSIDCFKCGNVRNRHFQYTSKFKKCILNHYLEIYTFRIEFKKANDIISKGFAHKMPHISAQWFLFHSATTHKSKIVNAWKHTMWMVKHRRNAASFQWNGEGIAFQMNVKTWAIKSL